jgi:hypothetical protein
VISLDVSKDLAHGPPITLGLSSSPLCGISLVPGTRFSHSFFSNRNASTTHVLMLLATAERCPVGNIRDKNFNAISDVAFSPVSVCLCITPQTLKCRPAGFMIAFAYLRQPALAIGDWSLLITRSAIPCSAPRLLAMLSPEKNRWTPWLHPAA